jgi:peptidoglycan/xylan/chitin deacetylase (PgdA/CDA1 family)
MRFTYYQLTKISVLVGVLIAALTVFITHSLHLFIRCLVIIFFFREIFYIYGMFSIRSDFFFKTVKGRKFFLSHEGTNASGILFRFDDGPHPIYTPQILDILKLEGIQALFAVTGKNAEMYPEIVQRMHRENHIIANHTYSHPLNILFLGYNRIREELTQTNVIIENITGVKPRYFCPPIGHKNQIIGKVIKDLGLIPLMWDIRTWDTRLPYEKIMAEIKKKMKSPAIIMFHDSIIHSKTDRESTVLAVKETIRFLKEQHYL